ncbi:hypothetical protein NDO75_06110 [Natrinema sp. 1APR25-10V2]|nr:hypothetical protein [Natrinema sp. 1APR25-10V2]
MTDGDVAETCLESAREGEFDTIIVGAAGEGIRRRVLFGEILVPIGEQFDGEVVMVRTHRPVQSAVKGIVRK